MNEELTDIFNCYIKSFNGINNITVALLKKIGELIGSQEIIDISLFDFVSTLLSKVKNNIYHDEKTDKNEIYNIIIEIIHKRLFIKQEFYNIYDVYDNFYDPLFLAFQLLSLNIDLDQQTVIYIVNQALNLSDYIEQDDDDDFLEHDLIQIVLAIICLGFLYYPKDSLHVFNDKSTIFNSSSSPSKMEKFINLLKKKYFFRVKIYKYFIK
jgi:hypothetical protein